VLKQNLSQMLSVKSLTDNSAEENQQPRPKGTGYVASPEELHSGFNTNNKHPEGRGIKPLSTNKRRSFL
jgi:hypothetical protein